MPSPHSHYCWLPQTRQFPGCTDYNSSLYRLPWIPPPPIFIKIYMDLMVLVHSPTAIFTQPLIMMSLYPVYHLNIIHHQCLHPSTPQVWSAWALTFLDVLTVSIVDTPSWSPTLTISMFDMHISWMIFLPPLYWHLQSLNFPCQTTIPLHVVCAKVAMPPKSMGIGNAILMADTTWMGALHGWGIHRLLVGFIVVGCIPLVYACICNTHNF